jgi:TPP-dependent pyruvate/acetoin dehydrogenase alpha subunit
MHRYPPFDPPEYVDWEPDPDAIEAFGDLLAGDPQRRSVIAGLAPQTFLDLYGGLLRNRLHDIELKRWVRRGVISKAWLGTGEEAVTIGAVHALDRTRDVVAPMIRNAGACHEMGMPLEQLFLGYLGTADGPNGGRDLHIGSARHRVLQPISHVGDMVPVITGVALAFKARGQAAVALTWIGDGSTKTATVHEGLNLAAVQRVPAIFIIQNNQVALGTRLGQHHAGDFGEWPRMYGVAGAKVDGNNVLDVFAAVRIAAERARGGGGPTIIVAETFRMGGHATHDEAEARRTFPDELFGAWGRRDPVGLYEEWLVGRGVPRDRLAQVEAQVGAEVTAAAERALEGREARMPSGGQAEFQGISAGVRQPGLAHRAG